jgi:hypothetical protein
MNTQFWEFGDVVPGAANSLHGKVLRVSKIPKYRPIGCKREKW